MQEQDFILGAVLIKPKHNQIIRDDNIVMLEPLAMAMLLLLVKRQGEVVSVSELFKQLWPGKVVSDNALHRIVGQIRKALGDNASAPQYIRTVKKSGYELLADIDIAPVSRANKRRKLSFTAVILLLLVSALIIDWPVADPAEPFLSSQHQFSDVRQLTSFPGLERDALFWPQSEAVIFTWQPKGELFNNIMVRSLKTGEHYRLSDDYFHYRHLALSADGQKIAFVRRDDKHCVIAYAKLLPDSLISNIKVLTECPFQSSNYLSWSGDGQNLIYNRNGYQYKRSELMAINIVSLDISPVLPSTPAASADYYPVVEPDGNRLAYVRGLSDSYQLRIYDNLSKEDKLLWQTFDKAAIIRFDWLANQQGLLLQIGKEFMQLNFDGVITPIEHSITERMSSIRVNELNQVLLTSEQYYNQISEFQLPSKHQAPIAEHQQGVVLVESSKSEYNPHYADDGEGLTFLSNREHSDYRLWQFTDGRAKLVTEQTVIYASPWSSDHKQILFITPEQQLFIYNSNTKQAKMLLEQHQEVLAMAWSQRPNVIYICRLVEGQQQIFALNTEDLTQTQITDNGGYAMQESSDGRYLFYNKVHHNGLWRYDTNTKQHLELRANFNQLNASRWQLFDNGIYFIRDEFGARGLFYYDFALASTQKLIDNKEFHGFDVAPDRSKVLLSEKKRLLGDLYLAELK